MKNTPFQIDPKQALNQYADMIYRLCRVNSPTKEYAEDAFQEVFLKLAACRKKFESEEHLKAWIIRVTINQCRSLYAASHWNKIQPLEDSEVSAGEGCSPGPEDDHFGQTDRRLAVEEALSTLPPEERTMIHLFYYEELSMEEIGRCLGIGQSLLRVRFHRVRKKLRAYYEERGLGYEDL